MANTTVTENAWKNEPSWFTKKLWWFSTAIPNVVKDCTTDNNRYKVIGLAVMFTWLYATLAWSFFWSTNTNDPLIYLPMGLFMGLFVLAIDRVLIASINKKNKNLAGVILRIGLAIAIGAFLAQPVILFIFKSDINREVPLLLDKKKQEKKKEIEAVYATRKAELLNERGLKDSGLSLKKQEMFLAEQEYLKEIDGTGGSGKYGIGGIAKQKHQTFLSQKAQYDSLVQVNGTALKGIQGSIDSVDFKIEQDYRQYAADITNSGFLVKKEALESLFKKDSTGTLEKQYFLLLVILTLFELIPIISKMFLPTGTYDEKLLSMEAAEMNAHQRSIEDRRNHDKLYRELIANHDGDLARAFFADSQEDRRAKMNEMIRVWRNNPDESFDDFWERCRDEVFTRH